MTPFLKELFNVIAIDTDYLTNVYLTPDEMKYLGTTLKSISDLDGCYSDKQGQNLEVLLYFLWSHAEDIKQIGEEPSRKEILVELYSSGTISGHYDCFHFDLSKFEKTYKPSGKELTLYRIGRCRETTESLGNSWSKD